MHVETATLEIVNALINQESIDINKATTEEWIGHHFCMACGYRPS